MRMYKFCGISALKPQIHLNNIFKKLHPCLTETKLHLHYREMIVNDVWENNFCLL